MIARNRGGNFFFRVCVSPMKGGFSLFPFTSGQAVSLSTYFCSAFDADACFSPLKKTEKSTMKGKRKSSSFDSCHLRFFTLYVFTLQIQNHLL